MDLVHEKGLKVVVATHYGEVFYLAHKYAPVAVTLDVKLPDASGWRVLDLFKNDVNYRHIPIHLISGEENRSLAMSRGARSFHLKPLSGDALNALLDDIAGFDPEKSRELLIIEDNEPDCSMIAKMLDQGEKVHVTLASSGREALDLIREKEFDAITVDYGVPDMSGLELVTGISAIRDQKIMPMTIYSARDFSAKEKGQLKQYANSILLKNPQSTPDCCCRKSSCTSYIVHKDLPAEKRRIIENLRLKEDVLSGKGVLVVDDDVRNLFALTAAFEKYNIDTITAESGQDAIQILNEHQGIDMVLMDIMMPEMDGYETTQKIRREHKNSNLPIIAVTAKAMKGDREKCLEAGASDYITKPVKIDQLLSLMRIWLFK